MAAARVAISSHVIHEGRGAIQVAALWFKTANSPTKYVASLHAIPSFEIQNFYWMFHSMNLNLKIQALNEKLD